MPKAYLIDMDGVLVSGYRLIPGAAQFMERLQSKGLPFLLLTNNSRFTPQEHRKGLGKLGISLPEKVIFTSALATARFVKEHCPQGSAFIIGERGLTEALEDVSFKVTEENPDYVIIGETVSYSFERITRAIRFIREGARFIATNPDVIGPTDQGVVPTCGATAALLSAATGVKPYFVGKPNPLMMRSALRQIGAHSENTVMIGDRMDTDIVGGIESGMETILVLSGVTREKDVRRFPYRPHRIAESVAEIQP